MYVIILRYFQTKSRHKNRPLSFFYEVDFELNMETWLYQDGFESYSEIENITLRKSLYPFVVRKMNYFLFVFLPCLF